MEWHRKFGKVERSARQLQELGVVFPPVKYIQYRCVDLTGFSGTCEDLTLLEDLVVLKELDPASGNLTIDAKQSSLTDECVPYLKVLSNLEELDIRGTTITDDGVQELQNAIPGCNILR